MALRRVNRRVRALDMATVKAYLFAPTRAEDDPGFKVCDATKDDWIRYVKSESQALLSRAMTWKDGKIYIVELPGRVHELTNEFFKMLMVGANSATGTGDQHLESAGSTYVDAMAHIEPDTGFGPTPFVGAARPAELAWGEFQTLKVEVGVSRGWSLLNARAQEWSHFPGVEYILCIRISPALLVRQYRLFSVVGQAIQQPVMPKTDIVNPTMVAFDSHRLLRLPPHVPLPAGFAQPDVIVDLWQVVVRLLARA